ncbi:hypothetical protein PH213_42440 [Streptomyces sp. SRF1]|uniref:hypothetical protein n=1 Tax=Streptomyces sp. SRF1 TaxID=1549642 RepID=UPI0025B02ACF|nr:hypothetical protein [Streptomyces sp. SRF1]MDN3061045.1 hypothetical protein [Streptomyces sp. SRF1]
MSLATWSAFDDVDGEVAAGGLLVLRAGSRFTRIEPRRRMRDYVRGLLAPAA